MSSRNLARTENKYGNRKTELDGVLFDSNAEARRYNELKLMVLAGAIHSLGMQVRFQITVNDVDICAYVADFRYYDNELGRWIYEDVKGVKTREYKIKKRLMKATHGIDIVEIEA